MRATMRSLSRRPKVSLTTLAPYKRHLVALHHDLVRLRRKAREEAVIARRRCGHGDMPVRSRRAPVQGDLARCSSGRSDLHLDGGLCALCGSAWRVPDPSFT